MIGILGGYGRIGLSVSRQLYQDGLPVRIGGRTVEEQKEQLASMMPKAEFCKVDIENPEELAHFMEGLDMVINCSGPAYQISGILAGQKIFSKIPLVDIGILSKEQKTGLDGQKVIYGSGAVPGLSGVLVKSLAREFSSVSEVRSYYCLRDIFTRTAAKDFIEGVFHKKTMVSDKELAFANDYPEELFGSHAVAFPYEDEETALVREQIGLKSGYWYALRDGRHLEQAILKIGNREATDEDIMAVCNASKMDQMMKEPELIFYIWMRGQKDGEEKEKVLCFQGKEPWKISAFMLADVAKCLLDGKREVTLSMLAALNGVEELTDRLAGQDFTEVYTIQDYDDFQSFEDGEI